MKKSNRKQVWEAVKSIMLVYADPIMLQTLNCLLNMNGYQVVNSFQTGRSALRFLKSGPQVDLVLLGCYLQDMDTVRFLRQMEQECADRHLRVILTGPARYIELVEQGHLSNCVDYYMIEPYDSDDLLSALAMFSPARRFPQVTPLDKIIHRQLRVLGVSDTMEGYWYLGGCLQEWLRLIRRRTGSSDEKRFAGCGALSWGGGKSGGKRDSSGNPAAEKRGEDSCSLPKDEAVSRLAGRSRLGGILAGRFERRL